MSRPAKTLFLMAAVCWSVDSSLAQRKSQRPAAKPRVAAKRAPKPDPIAILARSLAVNSLQDGDEKNLAAACDGTNYAGLILALQDVVSDWDREKGEFETTSDYEASRARQAEAINGKQRTLVCVPIAKAGGWMRYDADKQRYIVSDLSHRTLTSVDKDTGSYISSTRMGVKARVYQSVAIEFVLDPGARSYELPKKIGCNSTDIYSAGLTFAVDPSRAQLLHDQGYLAMMGRLRPPFVTSSDRSSRPSLDSPFDTTTRTMTLNLDVDEVALAGPGGLRLACIKP